MKCLNKCGAKLDPANKFKTNLELEIFDVLFCARCKTFHSSDGTMMLENQKVIKIKRGESKDDNNKKMQKRFLHKCPTRHAEPQVV